MHTPSLLWAEVIVAVALEMLPQIRLQCVPAWGRRWSMPESSSALMTGGCQMQTILHIEGLKTHRVCSVQAYCKMVVSGTPALLLSCTFALTSVS